MTDQRLVPRACPDQMEQTVWTQSYIRVAHQLVLADRRAQERVPIVELMPNQSVVAVGQMKAVFAVTFEVSEEISFACSLIKRIWFSFTTQRLARVVISVSEHEDQEQQSRCN